MPPTPHSQTAATWDSQRHMSWLRNERQQPDLGTQWTLKDAVAFFNVQISGWAWEVREKSEMEK
jgi:hypothetical protein